MSITNNRHHYQTLLPVKSVEALYLVNNYNPHHASYSCPHLNSFKNRKFNTKYKHLYERDPTCT